MDQTTTNKERAVSLNEEMYVTKRDGKREIVSFDKILNRIKKIGQEAHMKLNYTTLVMKVIDQLYDGISTTKIDELSAEQCASMASIHPDYNVLAGSIIISNHHSNTLSSFVEVMTQLYNFKDKHGKQSPLISEETFQHIINNADIFDEMCCYNRDYLIDYFGFKTLERAYLMKINNKIVERIQHMWLRVSIGIHGDNMDRIKETYDLMSQKYFTHATPTLFNSGTPRPQNSSCFLLAMESDSIEGIYNTLKDCALISKWAGGIGLHIHNVRASGSHIRGTNGSSNGIVPMLKVFNNTAKYVDQCLDPETRVYTKRGVIPIKSIIIGDEVVTDDGNFYEIGKVLDNQYTGDFYTLEVQDSSGPIKMTDMHPLWCIQNPDNQDGYHMKNMLDKKMIAPDFIEVKNINKNDYIGFPIPKYEKDISEYTEDDCYFYGIFINSIVHQNAFINSKSDDPSIKLYIPMLKTKTIQFVEDYLNSYAIPFKNCNEKMVFTSFGMQNLLIFEWERCNRFKFTYEMFYEGVPALLHLPKPKLLKLIQGVLELKISSINENYYVINNVKGSNIFDHLRYMLLRLGVLTSGDNTILNIPLNAVNRILQIDVTIPYKPNDYFQYNDTLFSKVTKNTFITNYSGRVIDIEVDNADHHNFLTQNGLVKNGGGKRNGSFAIYLEPWHADIEIFLQMRKNHGDEELKARDLFYALWIPDLFMERIKADGQWTLMCPDECPGLSDVYGDAFVELYTKYEQEGKGRATVKARDLWFQVLDAQMETGTPYLVYKDAANKKSNQQNVGTIKSSNLCSEIIQYSDFEETAVCFTGDTMVLTKEGYIRIDECDGKDVMSYFNNDSEFKETQEFVRASLIDNGEKYIYELECFGKKKIKATSNHLFAVIEKRNKDTKINTYKWKKLIDLDEGDKIAFPKTNILPNFDNKIFENIDEDHLTVGWMVGDGWQCKKSKTSDTLVYGVCFGPNETYARDRVLPKLNEWLENADFEKNGYNSKTTEYRTDKRTGVFSWASSKKQFVKYVQDTFGLMEHTAHYKVIPDKVKKASPSQKASFLSGLFSADGNVFVTNKNGRERFNINLASSSKPLLDDVHNMLKEFGVESLIIFGNVKNRPNKQGKVSIENKDSVMNFYKYINFVLCKEKQQTLEFGIKTMKKKEMFTGFARVKSINYVGVEKVYDLNVPVTHNFIAEGFVVHNCNLASLSLPSFIDTTDPTNPIIDYEKLHEVTKVITYNLNQIIDVNYYPTEKTRRSNMRHRPIGIGVQGLADVFMLLNLPFTSDEAKKINHRIFETIYHGAVEQSCQMALQYGHYETFEGSPASEGKLQFDLWNVTPNLPGEKSRYDWDNLKKYVQMYGLRNSLLLAPMPTASTSQILGNNECIEPITSNIYNRRTIAGEFILANKYLMKDLIQLDLWNEKVKNNIIANNGSVQHIEAIPPEIREKYKTVWEIPMRTLIDMAADRGAFVCQSQSLNLWLEDPNYNMLTSMHFYAWSKGLKTGIYYLRRRGRHQAQQFTIEPEKKNLGGGQIYEEEEVCEMCSA